MLPLRHKEEYFVKYRYIQLAKTTNSLKYGDVSWIIFEIGVLVTSVWAQQLQDPLHREEKEARFILSMD
jgi:hypothetical protein